MEANLFISSFTAIPIIGFLIILFIPQKKEKSISRIALITTGTHLVSSIFFIIYWIFQSFQHYQVEELILYQSKEYKFIISFLFDRTSATYLIVGSLITFLIISYSKHYMHLENGYKRFFSTILMFFLGYNFTLLSNNFETLFLGWEILGISSFLLIAFYYERYLPVRNSVKVFSIYRIGDLGVLAAMWATHHLWHENFTFFKLENQDLVHQHLLGHSDLGFFIGVMILLAAAAKSAQFPFSSWIPRAMEGPTPSSAIFYGSLSVHFGVFLLLRTYPLWHEQLMVKILVIFTGLTTAFIGHHISKIQSSIKAQIAYSSITQIGLIFVEVALGWHILSMIHFAGNAFLRTYQLLISPSVVSYLIHYQLYNFSASSNNIYSKLSNSIYILSLKEWYLDEIMSSFFNKIKQGGQLLNFLTFSNVTIFFVPIYLMSFILYLQPQKIPVVIQPYLAGFVALIGFLMVMRSFSERKQPILSWLLIIFNHFCLALSVSFNEKFDYIETIIFLAGIVVSGIVGLVCLVILYKKETSDFNLYGYKGFISKYPTLGYTYFFATLGMMGFPITSAFVGEDLLFSHIQHNQYILALLIALSFVIGGISLIRIYSRLFLGTYIKTIYSNSLKNA